MNKQLIAMKKLGKLYLLRAFALLENTLNV